MMNVHRGGALLFLCVANSSRSQMAEGFARHMAPEGTEVYSAGSAPTALNPLARDVMQEVGIDISQQSAQSVETIDKSRIGTVITLCGEEVCPVFEGNVSHHHWPLPDPAAARGTLTERRNAFRQVRDEIRARLSAYFGSAS